jgi:hypothetical protein
MKKNILQATLREKITTQVMVDVDFNKDWINASTIIENMKAKSFLEIKQKMHEKIATLTLEDLEFKIIN